MKISLFYKNVTVLDYAYLDDHRGVVGDALKVHVEFIGKTDEEGVIYDFSYAKKKVKEIIDRDCDHRLVIPCGLAEESEEGRSSFHFSYGLNEASLRYECPKEGLCELPAKHVSKETITTYLEDIILAEMPDTVTAIKLTLEDENFGAEKAVFHYTHGLKEHYGNCQRLFHGHKNTVDVFINGKQNKELEEYLASDLFKSSIHFCKWENIQNQDEVKAAFGGKAPLGVLESALPLKIEYTSQQGRFSAELAASEVYIMEEESTVENLSMLFARLIRNKVGPEKRVTIRAYEGIAKGAMSSL